jgi:CRP-like cAMP-binding protein
METYPVGVSDDPRLATQFAATATRLDLDAGSRLVVQGRRRQEFGVVISGRARVVRDGAVVAELRAGDHFGEFTVLRGLPSPVTIVADEPTSVAVLTGSEFRGTVGADDGFRTELERTLDSRIREWVAVADAASVGERAIA